MADFRFDQAAGLRRLFGGESMQVVAFAAGSEGLGRSLTVANLASALARLGKDVLVLDENVDGDNVASMFGLISSFDLLDVIEGACTMSEVLLRPTDGFYLLPAAKLVQRLGQLSRQQQAAFTGAMRHLESQVDIILVDAAISHPAGFSPFALAAHETVMVLSANNASITEAYAQIKKLSQAYARQDFRILVGKARNMADARAIFDNIADVAEQRGVAHLDFAGLVPFDDAMRLAHQRCMTVFELAPEGQAARALVDLAGDMLYWRQAQGVRPGSENFFQQLLHLSQRILPSAASAG